MSIKGRIGGLEGAMLLRDAKLAAYHWALAELRLKTFVPGTHTDPPCKACEALQPLRRTRDVGWRKFREAQERIEGGGDE